MEEQTTSIDEVSEPLSPPIEVLGAAPSLEVGVFVSNTVGHQAVFEMQNNSHRI